MPSYHRSLASAVADTIAAAAGDFPISSAVAALNYLPIYDLAQVSTPQIPVAPRTESRELASRSRSTREYVVQVAPHLAAKTVPGGRYDNEQIALFVDLMDAIANAIESAAKDGPIANATLTRASVDVLYDTDYLQTDNILRGLQTFTFRAIFGP